jgi:hypothetical protein
MNEILVIPGQQQHKYLSNRYINLALYTIITKYVGKD